MGSGTRCVHRCPGPKWGRHSARDRSVRARAEKEARSGASSRNTELLLRAAIDSGLSIPDEWMADEPLGGWLANALGLDTDESREQADSDPVGVLVLVGARAQELQRLLEGTARLEHDARLAFVGGCRSVFDDLERTIDGYVQLWRALASLGSRRSSRSAPSWSETNSTRSVTRSLARRARIAYVVRAAGIAVGDQVVAPARVERAEV